MLLNYVINYKKHCYACLDFTHSKRQNSYFEVQFLCQRSTSSGQLPTVLAKRAMFKSYRQQEMKKTLQVPQTTIFPPALWIVPKTTEIHHGQVSEFLFKESSKREVRNSEAASCSAETPPEWYRYMLNVKLANCVSLNYIYRSLCLSIHLPPQIFLYISPSVFVSSATIF